MGICWRQFSALCGHAILKSRSWTSSKAGQDMALFVSCKERTGDLQGKDNSVCVGKVGKLFCNLLSFCPTLRPSADVDRFTVNCFTTYHLKWDIAQLRR